MDHLLWGPFLAPWQPCLMAHPPLHAPKGPLKLPHPLMVSLSSVKPWDITEQDLQLWEAFLRLSVALSSFLWDQAVKTSPPC